MMVERRSTSGSSCRLALLFLGVVVPPAVTLVWLGLQLLEQDQSLWAQRELESRQALSESIIRSLERSVADATGGSETPLPDGMVRFTLSDDRLAVEPAARVLWFPVSAKFEEVETRSFEEAEKLEYQGGVERALVIYVRMAESTDAPVRAGALLRLARVQRRARRLHDALTAYQRLAEINEIAIDGMPADLVARRALCAILAESGDGQTLQTEATALKEDFLAGKWVLDQPAWELTAQQLECWVGEPLTFSEEAMGFSRLGDWLRDEWQRNQRGPSLAAGSSVIDRMTLITQSTGAAVSVVVISPGGLDAWIARALEAEVSTGHQLSLLTSSGDLLAGVQPPDGTGIVKRLASETGLPWTVVLSPDGSWPQTQDLAGRQRLLAIGLGAIVLLLAGGSYFLWRVIHRELAIARLQTEFVSAVSHEFRTPLASLRHVTELMQEDDDLPPERRRSFYEALGRNTERLYRLVESLLDFARMEGKRKPYELKVVDVSELVETVAADFGREVEPRGFKAVLDLEDRGAHTLLADAQALSSALWNLLDNAVKYSPEGRNVHLSVRRHPEGLAIAVRDDGLGIPQAEQGEIFRRFVRGEQASRLGIKGTGLGLAMVTRIVRAHGGKLELESEEGVGSTFRMVLPSQV